MKRSYPTFQSALAHGRAGEQLVRKLFEQSGRPTKDTKDGKSHQDFFTVDSHGRRMRVEVKRDDRYHHGNVFIEYCQYKPARWSGICISLSDIWISLVPSAAFVARTHALRQHIYNRVEGGKIGHERGDNHNCGFLISYHRLVQPWCQVVDRDVIVATADDMFTQSLPLNKTMPPMSESLLPRFSLFPLFPE